MSARREEEGTGCRDRAEDESWRRGVLSRRARADVRMLCIVFWTLGKEAEGTMGRPIHSRGFSLSLSPDPQPLSFPFFASLDGPDLTSGMTFFALAHSAQALPKLVAPLRSPSALRLLSTSTSWQCACSPPRLAQSRIPSPRPSPRSSPPAFFTSAPRANFPNLRSVSPPSASGVLGCTQPASTGRGNQIERQ